MRERKEFCIYWVAESVVVPLAEIRGTEAGLHRTDTCVQFVYIKCAVPMGQPVC